HGRARCPAEQEAPVARRQQGVEFVVITPAIGLLPENVAVGVYLHHPIILQPIIRVGLVARDEGIGIPADEVVPVARRNHFVQIFFVRAAVGLVPLLVAVGVHLYDPIILRTEASVGLVA